MSRDDEGEVVDQLANKAKGGDKQALQQLMNNEYFLSRTREICEPLAQQLETDPDEVEKNFYVKIDETVKKYGGKKGFMIWVKWVIEGLLIDQLGKEAIGGNRHALELLFKLDCFQERLKKICKRFTPRYDSELEDKLQDANLKILEVINKYSSKGSFSGWASTIVTNLNIDRERHWKVYVDGQKRSDSYEEHPENDVEEKRIEAIMIKETLATFSGMDREIFRLQLMGYKAGEIASKLRLEPEGVYRILENIWKKLCKKRSKK